MGIASSIPDKKPHLWTLSALDGRETDASRRKREDLQLQQRLNDKLREMRDELIASREAAEQAARSGVKQAPAGQTPTSKIAAGKAPVDQAPAGKTPVDLTPAGQAHAGRSTPAVAREVADLHARLDARLAAPAVAASNPAVDTANTNLIACLREKDRRPLDCQPEARQFGAAVDALLDRWV